MTVRDLMLHTAGLTYGAGPDALKEAYDRLKPLESTDLKEMTDKLAQVPLAFDPGTDWTYSVAIDVLGRVIEVASGETLDVFLKKTIFEPLDMPDTAFNVPPEKLARFAANYARSTGGLKVIDVPANSQYAKKVTFFSGGGGLVGTARDYVRFLTMIQNGGELDGHRILRPETVSLMTTNQLPKEAFPIHFDKAAPPGHGVWLWLLRPDGEHELGSRRPPRRIRLGRRRLHALLGQPGRQIDRGDARTDHALSMGHGVRREKDHLRLHQ